MTHDHHDHEGAQNIKVAFFLNLGFALAEIVGGLWTNSVTILSDALHDLGDSLTLGVSWYLDRYAHREETEEFSYGYQRFSLLGALITGVILIAGSVVVLSEAIPRLMDPESSNAKGMFVFALAGITVNGLAALRMRDGGNLNVQMVTWHLLEDVLGWIAVLVVSIVLFFWDLQRLDPILSILITLYVSYNVVRNLQKTLKLFLQSAPQDITAETIDEEIRDLPHVVDTHHTHIWSLDGENHVLTTHVVVDVCCDRTEVMDVKQAVKQMGDRLGMAHMTIEIEYSGDVCIMDGMDASAAGHEHAE